MSLYKEKRGHLSSSYRSIVARECEIMCILLFYWGWGVISMTVTFEDNHAWLYVGVFMLYLRSSFNDLSLTSPQLPSLLFLFLLLLLLKKCTQKYVFQLKKFIKIIFKKMLSLSFTHYPFFPSQRKKINIFSIVFDSIT